MTRALATEPGTSLRTLGALLALTLGGLMACGGDPPPPPETYSVRGIVRQVGMGPQAPLEILIHHEEIPQFRDDRGAAVGMESMAMPFTAADAALTEGLEAGDRIQFDFEVRWEGGPPLQLTRLEKLDPSVRLDFETAIEENTIEGGDARDAKDGDDSAPEDGATTSDNEPAADHDPSDHAHHGP